MRGIKRALCRHDLPDTTLWMKHFRSTIIEIQCSFTKFNIMDEAHQMILSILILKFSTFSDAISAPLKMPEQKNNYCI